MKNAQNHIRIESVGGYYELPYNNTDGQMSPIWLDRKITQGEYYDHNIEEICLVAYVENGKFHSFVEYDESGNAVNMESVVNSEFWNEYTNSHLNLLSDYEEITEK